MLCFSDVPKATGTVGFETGFKAKLRLLHLRWGIELCNAGVFIGRMTGHIRHIALELQ